jgi:hypothetical protein
MATLALGSNYNKILGWAKTSEVEQPSGEKVTVFRGVIAKLGDTLAAIAADKSLVYDDLKLEKDEELGTATITLTKSAVTTESKPANGQTRNPTVSIQGSMLSPQLHQHPTFANGKDKLTLSAIATTNYCLKNYGEVATGDLHGESEIAYTYARWRSYGIDTFLAPSYTMTLTFYISNTSHVKSFIQKAGKVFSFNTAVSLLPNDLKPKGIEVPAWLAQAPSINITADGITVSQAFVGAQAFPSFYETESEDLVYTPPELKDVYWRDLKHKREHSGEES